MKKTKIKDSDFAKMDQVYNDLDKHVDRSFYFYCSYSLRIIIMIASIIIIGYLSLKFYNESFTKGEESTLEYSESGNIDYNVKLFEDNLFETGTLNPTNNYISDLVDDISTDFIYQYKLDKTSDISYSYYINAIMELKGNSNGNIVSKNEYDLVSKIEEEKESTKEINIKQNINLDYDYYNELAKSIEKQYDKNIIGNLKLIMYIDVKIENNDFKEPIFHTQEIEVTIPLVSSEVTVSMVKNIDNQGIERETKNAKLINNITLYISITLLIIDTLFLLLTLSFILRTIPKKSKYTITLNRILNSYDDMIVNCKKLPHFEDYKIINCESFKELLDAANILEQPILYAEIVKNQKSIFIILNENNLYKYVLKECDIDF